MVFAPDDIASLVKQFRFSNYLSAAQLYLKDNFFLEEKLLPEHIKKRQLGHWGSVPGSAFIYVCLNYLIKKEQLSMIYVLGPGHAAPAILSQLYLEGTLGEFYPQYARNRQGAANLIKDFSWPGGLPSHVNPATPGAILEGGELGYSLATAYGAVLDNPELIVATVIGDGEAETGPLATAWQSNKFINLRDNGAVLPIVNINGYKISQPTVFGVMSDEELTAYFTGLNYLPVIVDVTELDQPEAFELMLNGLMTCYSQIRAEQARAKKGDLLKPKLPVLLLRSLKGWTGVKNYKDQKIEGNHLSHGVPILDPQLDNEKLELIESWLRSYAVTELMDEVGAPKADVLKHIPAGELRMGMNRHANGISTYKELKLSPIANFAVKLVGTERGCKQASNTDLMGAYLADALVNNSVEKNLRIFCPDETSSNKLDKLFNVTNRAFTWPLKQHDDRMAPDGRVMEMLSEHTLLGWLEGYILTGRHGLFASYEAFVQIITSMVDQYAKFLRQSEFVDWRLETASLNILLSSLGWRQEHNGFSHQNPGFISNMLDKYGHFMSIYFPPDANMTLVTTEDCLKRKNGINVIVAGKRNMPQWLTLEEAHRQQAIGLMEWEWAGNRRYDPDVVIAACGDYMTLEALAACQYLRELAPELKVRFVSVSELSCLGIGDERHPCTIGMSLFNQLFTEDKPIIFNFHGYPSAIHKLVHGHPASMRMFVHGYIDEGSTTTPFDMQLVNKTSRYHLALDAIYKAKAYNPSLNLDVDRLCKHIQAQIELDKKYILAAGEDPEAIVNFCWQN